jgi:PTS system D-glucosamine-specific IIC component
MDSAGKVVQTVFKGGQLADVLGLTSLQSGVFGGIVVGLGVAALHTRFYKQDLPTALSFFAGSRFVPIITTLVYVPVGILMYFVWPVLQEGLATAGYSLQEMGLPGTFIFGVVKRALIPFGLHHVWYTPFWYTELGGTYADLRIPDLAGLASVIQADGITAPIAGGQRAFFAQLAGMNGEAGLPFRHFSPDATRFFSGEFIFMMFGFPGAALAMYHCAKKENKKTAGGLLFSAALTSFFTGITEPIEFSFLFVAPLLFGAHVVIGGAAYMLAQALGVAVGLTFSGGFIDLTLFGILPGAAKTSWYWIPLLGVVYFFLYYGIFRFLIMKFNFKTPGREDEGEEIKLYTKADYNKKKAGEADEQSAAITIALGGKANIQDLDCCATRLRVTVKDPSKCMGKDTMKRSTGASGVVMSGNGVQIIFGPRVTIIKSKLEDFLAGVPATASDAADNLKAPEAAQEVTVTKTVTIASPLEGELIPMTEVPDEGFAQEAMGKGAAVIPSKGVIRAPFDGIVSMLFDTHHAINLTSKDGVELLIHIGIDTVKLGGKCFTPKAKEDERVTKGQVLMEFDIEGIKKAGYPIVSPICVINSGDYSSVVMAAPKGPVASGDTIIEVKK